MTNEELIAEALAAFGEATNGGDFDSWERLGRLVPRLASALAAANPGGKRLYAACWRDENGVLNSLESVTVLREHAEADVKRWKRDAEREENGQPARVVLATKIHHAWEPVGGDDA